VATSGSRLGAWVDKYRLRWPLRILSSTYLAFVLLVNLALNTSAPWGFLRPADKSSCISWSWGWSLLPGFAEVHNFYLTVEDDNIQLGLRIDRARVRYEPTAFLHQTFHATAVTAVGVSFRFRVKKTAEEIAQTGPEGLATLPVIPGFTDPPLRGSPSPPFQGDRSIYWTIKIDGVNAATREVWIEGVRYVGPAHAYGVFTFRPLTVVEVNAGLDIQGGELELDNNPLGQKLVGDLSVTVDRFDPLPEVGLEPLQHMVVDLDLDGEMQNVGLLNPLLNRLQAPSFESSAGRFDILAHFDHGKLLPRSRFWLQALRWEVARGRYRAIGTDTRIDGSIDESLDTPGGAHGRVQIALGPYQILDPRQGQELLEGQGMILRMTSDRLDVLDHPFTDLGYQIQLEAARVPNLAVLNEYLPKTKSFEVLGGTGEVTGTFLRPSSGAGDADFQIQTRNVALRVAKVKVLGDLGLKARLLGLASSSEELPLFRENQGEQLGENEIEGQGNLTGRFTLEDLEATGPDPLANFSLNAELVLHPLSRSRALSKEVLRSLSGELKLAGALPGLEFLNASLAPRGIELRGGAGDLTVDARLSHGVIGRATELAFASRAIQVTGGNFQGRGDLSVRARVDETSDTPRMTVLTGMRSGKVGTPDLPDFLAVHDLALRASSPEVDLRALAELRPTLHLTARELVLSDLATLDRWLPRPLHLTHGRAEVGLAGSSPPLGPGTLSATVELSGLRGTVGPVSIAGELAGDARLDGIAERPWKPELLSRSTLDASAALEGHCHLVATSPGDAPSTAQLHFRAFAKTPATQGSQLSQLVARTTGAVSLTGEVSNLAYVNQFLGTAPIRIRGGSASVSGEIELARGSVASGSTLALETHGLQASLGPLWLTGPLHLSGTLGAENTSERAQIQAALDSFTLENRFEGRVLAQGSGVSFALRAPSLSGEGLLLDSTFQGRVQQIAIPDLGSLAPYLPDLKDFELLSGSASATAALDHPSRDHGQAKLDLTADRVRVRVAGKPITADLRVGAVLRALAAAGSDGKPLLETLDVADTTVDLKGVDLATDRPSDRDWWAKLRVVRGEFGFGDETDKRVTLSADATVEARDALPWLHLYGSDLGVPRWLDWLLAFNRLKATAAFELRGNHFALPAFQADGDHLELLGRLLLSDQHTSGDFLLGVGPFSLGIDVRDKHSGLQWLGATSWYRDRLKQTLE